MNKLNIAVIKSPFRTYGYSLRHNQPIGWHGTMSNTYAWYRYKSDAIKAANDQMKPYQQRGVNAMTYEEINLAGQQSINDLKNNI